MALYALAVSLLQLLKISSYYSTCSFCGIWCYI